MRQQTQPTHRLRQISLVILGLVLFATAAWLFIDAKQRADNENASLPSAYNYTVNQSMQSTVNYFNSSFYDKGPGATNTAYVGDLTDTIEAQMTYNFKASRAADLTTMYSVTATIKEKFATGSDGKQVANVWSKEFPLLKPVVAQQTDQEISFSPRVSIPYAEYRQMADQIKTSLALPSTAEMTVAFTYHISGTVDGVRFDEVRVSTLSAPLDQPVYTLEQKFEKDDKKTVASKAAKTGKSYAVLAERISSAVAIMLGMAAIVLGLRRQIFKSPYQRELEKIYRYHDGLIIKASARTDLTNKTIVPVESFDDILNLEEELKVPILASPVGGTATYFMIVHGDIVYRYTLGKIEKDDVTTGRSIEEIEAYIEGHQSATIAEPKKPGHGIVSPRRTIEVYHEKKR